MSEKKNKSFWGAITQKADNLKETVSQKAVKASKSVTEKATEAAKQSVSQVGETISHKASEAGKTITGKATEAKNNLMDTATHSVESTFKKGQDWLDHLTSNLESPTSNSNDPDWSLDELYHIFISYYTASQGGNQTVTLKTGKSYTVRIPPNPTEGSNLRMKGCGVEGNDAFLVLHTFYNRDINIDRQVTSLVNQSPIHEQTKIRCLEAYNRLNNAQATEDFTALDLLDYLVLTSKLYSDLGQRYIIASHHSRSLGLEQCLEMALDSSELELSLQHRLKGIYHYIRSGEAVPDLEALTQIDTIIFNSALNPELKKYYLRGSITSRVLTLDILIINGIYNQGNWSEAEKKRIAKTYIQVREGQPVSDVLSLQLLDEWFKTALIPIAAKMVYQLIREGELDLNDEFMGNDYTEAFQTIQQVMQSISTQTKDYPATGINAINIAEVKIDRLAEKSYNSVSRGGLGLLSGNLMIRGAVPFIETTAKVAIATVAQFSIKDKLQFGIPALTETGIQSSAQGSNWMAVGSLGGTETRLSHLSGAAFYRAFLMEIEGLNGIAEPATPKSIPQGLGLLSLLKGKQDKQRIIQDLETQMYR